jgi:hypothetical protein
MAGRVPRDACWTRWWRAASQLPNFAALDREQKVWGELQKDFHPDEAERRRLLQDFDWK